MTKELIQKAIIWFLYWRCVLTRGAWCHIDGCKLRMIRIGRSAELKKRRLRTIRKKCIEFAEMTSFYRLHFFGGIRLADVLAAIRHANAGSYLAIDCDGLFIRIRPNHEFGWDLIEGYENRTSPAWDIYHDNLESQSPETIEFISKTLDV